MAKIMPTRGRVATVDGVASARLSANDGGPYGVQVYDKYKDKSYTVWLNDIELGEILRHWKDNEANAGGNVVNSFLSLT